MANLDVFKKVIAGVESGYNQYMMRVDRRLLIEYSRSAVKEYGRCKMINECDEDTALMILSTRWGLYQIPGYNLYEQLWLSEPIVMYLFNPFLQDVMFEEYLKVILGTREVENIIKFVINELKYLLKVFDWHQFRSYEEIIKDELKKIQHLVFFIEQYRGIVLNSKEFVEYVFKMKKYLDEVELRDKGIENG